MVEIKQTVFKKVKTQQFEALFKITIYLFTTYY